MGICDSTTSNSKNQTKRDIQEKRKSQIPSENIKLDVNMDESQSSVTLEKTNTTTCLISGDINKIQKILNTQNIDVNDYNKTNKTFFIEAIMKTEKTEIIEYLVVEKKANINLPEQQTGNTPIFLASVDLKINIVKLLLKHNPNIHHLNEENQNVIDFLKDWNNENEGMKRRSSLKRDLSLEEKEKFDGILNMLELYKNEHPKEEAK